MTRSHVLAVGLLLVPICLYGQDVAKSSRPAIVAHRGLLKHAPENTLSNFRACLELRMGFEVDVRRCQSGELVCVHDDSVDRTTNGKGKITDLSLSELRRLDAGSWFEPAFRDERIPTFEEVLIAIKHSTRGPTLVAVDLKAPDVEADTVRLAEQHGVLDRLLFIGLAIDDPAVRAKLQTGRNVQVACLAQNSSDLNHAIEDRNSNWVYLRFIPTRAEVALAHAAAKHVFIAGPTVAGLEITNWRQAINAHGDGILTDFPLELAEQIRISVDDPKKENSSEPESRN